MIVRKRDVVMAKRREGRKLREAWTEVNTRLEKERTRHHRRSRLDHAPRTKVPQHRIVKLQVVTLDCSFSLR
jgi:hypothetical protein